MKNVFVILISAVIGFSSCVSQNKEVDGPHKVEVKEVLQANAYTYLNIRENKKDQWIAVPKMEAQVGDIYFFDDFMEMNDFESKDLGRTFESVYFIQELRTEADSHAGHDHAAQGGMSTGHPAVPDVHKGKPEATQNEVKVEAAEGGITIAELFANREKYNGKKVLIKGEVVKANLEIMNKNWFHIQDGTADGENFDLTITSLENDIEVGSIVTFEGMIILNKDFGHGYSYEVLMEDAVVK